MSRFNVNTNHPIIPNSQNYTFYQKYITIYSGDRDILKYPNPAEFEIELPQDYLNVTAAVIQSWSFPPTNQFSIKNNNLQMSFKINEPYNALENNPLDPLQIDIYNALLSNINNNFVITIEEGSYILGSQLATELTNKMNTAVTDFISNYLISINSANIPFFTSYNEFKVAYNEISDVLWFGNSSSGFVITNSNTELYGPSVEKVMNQCYFNSLPEFNYWGLPAFLGFSRCDATSITNGSSFRPRFDYLPGTTGYWISPSILPNSSIYFLKANNNVNVRNYWFYYLDIQELNCMDQTSPYNLSKFTLQTNETNGRVNSAFARVIVDPNSNSLSQWYTPYKLFEPPAERIRRLHIRVVNHNGQLVDFRNHEFSFMMEFTLYNSQIQRKYNLYNPEINR